MKGFFLVLTPCIYFNKSNYFNIYKSFGEKELSKFSLQPITQTYKEIKQGKELYFLDENKPFKFKTDKFFLKKSELKAEGPVYEELEEYGLEN